MGGVGGIPQGGSTSGLQLPSWLSGSYGQGAGTSPTNSLQAAATGTATTATSPPPPPVSPPAPTAADPSAGLATQTGQMAPPPPAAAAPAATDIGLPSWYQDFAKSGETDLNKWYQQNQGGYMKTLEQKTPDQLVFGSPPPPPAATPAAAAAAAPAAPAGNYWDPRYGPEPVLTAAQKLKTQIPGALHYNASPDPAVMNWMRWNLGEQGFQRYMQERTGQRQTWADQAANKGAPGDRLDR